MGYENTKITQHQLTELSQCVFTNVKTIPPLDTRYGKTSVMLIACKNALKLVRVCPAEEFGRDHWRRDTRVESERRVCTALNSSVGGRVLAAAEWRERPRDRVTTLCRLGPRAAETTGFHTELDWKDRVLFSQCLWVLSILSWSPFLFFYYFFIND